MVASALVAVASAIAIGIIVAQAGGFHNALIQNKLCMLSSMSLGGASIAIFCIAAAHRHRLNKPNDPFEKERLNRQQVEKVFFDKLNKKEALRQVVEKFFNNNEFVSRNPHHPFTHLPDVLKGIICQYASFAEADFLRMEFGLNKAAILELYKTWQARFGSMSIENIKTGFVQLALECEQAGSVARDGLDHVILPLRRVLYWENLELSCKVRILINLDSSYDQIAAIGLLLKPNEGKIPIGAYDFDFEGHGSRENHLVKLAVTLFHSNDQKLINLLLDCLSIEGLNERINWDFTNSIDNEETVLFILKKGVKVKDGTLKIFRLYEFVVSGWFKVLEFLLDNEPSYLPHINDKALGKTLLHHALLINVWRIDNRLSELPIKTITDIVTLLISKGASKTIRDDKNKTPLDYAKENNLEDLIPLLSV